MTVTIGSRALRVMCVMMTVCSRRPLARAVRMKSSPSTEMTEARMNRATPATPGREMISTGMIMCVL